MKSAIVVVLAAVLLLAPEFSEAQDLPLTQYVVPFVGTGPNPTAKAGPGAIAGNTFPGAVCPDGMLAWSPDTPTSVKAKGGYWYPDSTIIQFSLTHFSGRGVTYLMDIPFMPIALPITESPGTDWVSLAARFSHSNEQASPGYYSVKFDNEVRTELTATTRSGMARFSFPDNSAAALCIKTDGFVSVSGKEVTGYHNATIGGKARPFRIYFVAQFDQPFQSVRTWNGGAVSSASTQTGDTCGAIVAFNSEAGATIQVRVGISFVSIENAGLNLAAENGDRGFSAIRRKAESAWNSVLNLIQVTGGTKENLQNFYTALYHCFIHPNVLEDVNGEYLGMDGKVHTVSAGRHQYQNITAWDSYRTLMPLIAIVAPEKSSDVCQSLVNFALQDAAIRPDGGGFPRWQQVNRNSGGMIGDGDDNIIASSYVFGARRFDTTAALAIADKGASTPDVTSDGFQVRSSLNEYLKLGYIPAGVPASVSKTLEYCNSDFALAQYALAMGDKKKHDVYLQRAQNWKNLFDPPAGLLRPKNEDGSWGANFSPSTRAGYTEGTASQYVWLVNFNLKGLVDAMGGNKSAIARLDTFFTHVNAGSGTVYMYIGNETDFEVPWIYNFVGAPWRTQEVVRRIQTETFTTLPGGLAGNDDAGALSSWYVFSALGFYPQIPGTDILVLGSPLFQKAVMHLRDGDVTIVGRGAENGAPFVRQLSMNGKAWNRPWIRFADIARGGTLDFTLSSEKDTGWGSGAEDAPPSY